MASAVYPKWKEALLQNTTASDLDQSGNDGVYAALIDTGVYTYSSAHQYWDTGGASDPIDALVGTAVELTSKTYTSGAFDAADTTFTSVSGNSVEAIIIYRKNTGATTTWQLVAYLDSANVTGLPVTPNGGDIVVAWHANGIFTL